MTDWDDSGKMDQFALETIKFAELYHNARTGHAQAKIAINAILASKYLKKEMEVKLAYEKALIMLVAESGEEVKGYYESMLQNEAEYKGLEKILEARQARISLSQSLIKNKVKNG